MKNTALVRCVQLVTVRQTHHRQAVIADPNGAPSVRRQIQKHVDHVSVFMEQRREDLQDSRALLLEADVPVELLAQIVQVAHWLGSCSSKGRLVWLESGKCAAASIMFTSRKK